MAELIRNHIYTGDAIAMLQQMPDRCVQVCVTSPPYFGLRDYGTAKWEGGDPTCDHKSGRFSRGGLSAKQASNAGSNGDEACRVCPKCGAARVDQQIGLEETPELYVARMVEVFREVRRVLRDDGTLWLNLGSTYNGSGGAGGDYNEGGLKAGQPRYPGHKLPHYKPKDLIPIPWMVAMALQTDGWWLRSDIIWAKPNPMPSSVTDRPTTSHEYLFLFAKSGDHTFWTHRDGMGSRIKPKPDYRWLNIFTNEETDTEPPDWWKYKIPDGRKLWRRINLWHGHDYYYDAEAIREPHTTADDPRNRPDYKPKRGRLVSMPDGDIQHIGTVGPSTWPKGGRNKRSVWTISTHAFPEAHFATFPPALIEPCILVGSSPQACPKCGAPWKREIEKHLEPTKKATKTFIVDKRDANADNNDQGSNRQKDGHKPGWRRADVTTGWSPTCSCPNDGSGRCIVLDPFMGSGTTALVAFEHGRDYVGIELNPEYVEMANRRLNKAVYQERLFV